MLDDTTPDPDLEFEDEDDALHESLPELGPPPPEDYGIPGIDVDRRGQFKVARQNPPGFKLDNWLLEQAQTEFFLGWGWTI